MQEIAGEVAILPESMVLDNQRVYRGILSRQKSYIQAMNNNNMKNGQIIQFSLPQEVIDGRKSSIQFNATITPGAGATFARFSQDISCIFKRFYISISGKVVVDQQQNNLWYAINDQILDPQVFGSNYLIPRGTGSTVQRNTDGTSTTKKYAVVPYQMSTDFFHNILYVSKTNLQWILNIELADPSLCIETDGATPSYTLNNIEYHYDSLILSNEINNYFNESVSKNPISLVYTTYNNQSDTSTLLAGITSFSKTLTFKYSSALGLVVVMRNLTNVSNLATNQKLLTYNFLGVNSWYVRIGSATFPSFMTETDSDLMLNLEQFFGIKTTQPWLGASTYNTTSAVFVIPFLKHPHEMRDNSVSLSGVDLSISTQMVLFGQFSAPLAAQQQMDVFLVNESLIQYMQNGAINFFE